MLTDGDNDTLLLMANINNVQHNFTGNSISALMEEFRWFSPLPPPKPTLFFLPPRPHHHQGSRWGPYFEDGPGPHNITARVGQTVRLDCKIGLLHDKTVSGFGACAYKRRLSVKIGICLYLKKSARLISFSVVITLLVWQKPIFPIRCSPTALYVHLKLWLNFKVFKECHLFLRRN